MEKIYKEELQKLMPFLRLWQKAGQFKLRMAMVGKI